MMFIELNVTLLVKTKLIPLNDIQELKKVEYRHVIVTTTSHSVHLTRSASVVEVTGNITCGDWTTGSFDSYDVPSVEGYTASQDKVDTDKVTSDTQNSEVNISYTANDQAIKINYVDSDNRSEERRVGKECRARRAPCHAIKREKLNYELTSERQ